VPEVTPIPGSLRMENPVTRREMKLRYLHTGTLDRQYA
jgi:hypothetical protein